MPTSYRYDGATVPQQPPCIESICAHSCCRKRRRCSEHEHSQLRSNHETPSVADITSRFEHEWVLTSASHSKELQSPMLVNMASRSFVLNSLIIEKYPTHITFTFARSTGAAESPSCSRIHRNRHANDVDKAHARLTVCSLSS